MKHRLARLVMGIGTLHRHIPIPIPNTANSRTSLHPEIFIFLRHGLFISRRVIGRRLESKMA
jgi:hypothetical protein